MRVFQRLTSTVAAVAIVAVVFGSGPQQVFACSCAGVSPDEAYVRDLLARSDAVVVGAVGDWQEAAPNSHGYTTMATVNVYRVHDGTVNSTITVYTGDSAGGCGYAAALRDGEGDEHLLVLMKDDAGRHHASFCTSFPMASIVVPEREYEQRLLGFLETLRLIAPSHGPEYDEVFTKDDFSSDDDGAPGWLLPSLLGLGAVSVVSIAVWALRGRDESLTASV